MFDKKQTLKVKGIAILMLIFHHLFYSAQRIDAAGITFRFLEKATVMNIATGMRLCVWIFAFLSAYGLSIQYSKLGSAPTSEDTICFVWKRWISLMQPYWIVMIATVFIAAILGKNPLVLFGGNPIGIGVGALGMSDLFGMKMPVAAWWYMCFAQILLFGIPLLSGLCKKYGILILVGAFIILPFAGGGIVSPYGGYYFNYLFVVILGVYCAQNSILDKIGAKQSCGILGILEAIVTIFLIIGCVAFNIKFSSGDTWRITKLGMSFASILVCLFVYRHLSWRPLDNLLCYLGKYSGYLFLIHAFSYTYFPRITFWSSNALLTYLTVLIPGLLLSVMCDKFFSFLSNLKFEVKEASFSKNDTLMIKGVATLILLATHLFNRSEAAWSLFNYNTAWMIDGRPLISTLFTSSCGKVCVDLFVILSGYGLNLGMKARENENNRIESSVRFSLTRVVKLMIEFWFVFIMFVPLFSVLGKLDVRGVYGSGFKGIFAAMIDFLGLRDILFEVLHTGTINVTWWYMSTVLILYAMFPLLRMCVKTKGRFLWLFAMLLINVYAPFATYRQMRTGAFFYLAAFYLGMLMAEIGALDALKRWMQKSQLIKTMLMTILLLCTFLFTRKYPFWGELLYAMVWMVVCIGLFTERSGVFSNKYFRKPFEIVGKYSSNIFFVHTFFLFGFPELVYLPRNPILTLIWFTVWMTLVSYLLEWIKKLFRLNVLERSIIRRI